MLKLATQKGYTVFFSVSYVFAAFSWIFLYKCFRKLSKEQV